MGVTREDPPATHQRREFVDWTAVIAEIKSHPGQWHNVGEFSPGIANHIRKGAYKQFLVADDPTPPENQMARDWDITSRTVSTNPQRVDIYIRWIGQ